MPSEGGARKGVAMMAPEKIYKVNARLEGAANLAAAVAAWVLLWIRAEKALFHEQKGVVYSALLIIACLAGCALLGHAIWLVDIAWR